MYVCRLNKQFQFPNRSVLAMKKTPVWNDMVSSTAVDKTGSKDVLLQTIRHEEVCVSFCLAGKGDGTNLKPPVVVAVANVTQKVCISNLSVSVPLHQVQMVG